MKTDNKGTRLENYTPQQLLTQLSSLHQLPYNQTIPAFFPQFMPIYPSIQNISPVGQEQIPGFFPQFMPIYPSMKNISPVGQEQKRARATCVKCQRASCTGAKTRVKKGQIRLCSTLNIILD